MLKLFTTPSCTQCPIVKSMLDINGIPYEEIDALANPHVAAEYGIQVVPTIVVNDEDRHVGTGACLTYLNGVNSMGETLYDSLLNEKEKKLGETIYLAGDILSEGAKMRRAWEADQIRSIGATLHVPHEDASINDKANAVQEGLAERIVANDTQGIIDSDVIVIDAHENGKGTLVELGQIKGMRDMAELILGVRKRFEERHEKDGDWASYFDMSQDELEAIYEIAESATAKKIYAHNTDIRRANSDPQAGDRREYAPNQYVYGTVLELTNNHGFYTWEEIIEEVKEMCE